MQSKVNETVTIFYPNREKGIRKEEQNSYLSRYSWSASRCEKCEMRSSKSSRMGNLEGREVV